MSLPVQLPLSPGHAAVVAHPAVLLLVVAAAPLARVQLAVQTLALVVDEELEGLQAADAVGVAQVGLGAQQLPLGVLLLDLSLQLPGGREGDGRTETQRHRDRDRETHKQRQRQRDRDT